MNVRKSNLVWDKPIRPNSTFIAMLLVLLSMLLFVQPAFAQTGIPPTNDNRPGGLPANGTCGVDGLGNYVKFTAGGGDGTGLIATATGGNGGTLTAIYNQTSSASGGTFQITSLTLNGEPLLIAEVIGGAGSKNPIWVFTPSILAPTPVLATNVDKNFSQFALCAYDAIAPFSLTKTVDSGSGSFTFDVVCKSPTSGVVLLTTTVTLDVTAGTPTTQQVFGNVPIGAICTATETGASPDIYDNDGPKSATVATATGAGVTINNTLKVGTLTLVKVVDNLGESGPGYLAVSDFPLTIGGNATTSGTPATVTAGSYTIAETSKPGYSVGSWSCTDGTSGTAGSTSATVNISAGENTTCTIVNTLIADPALTIDKVSSTTSFDAVGDVIDYTIVVANTGNVTLDTVTINDPGAELGTCVPAYGTALAPGASMTCQATHEVVQDDLDAGGFTNTACVTASGATEQCDDAVVPAEKKPALVIDKTSSTTNFSAVGDVINYTIVATNTGNVTLNSVMIDDPKVSGLSCVPDNGSALAPGASITCSATHRVTQEDLDAGSYANTACVDDGSGGAAATCDGATVPAVQDPSLAIVKSALPATYDSVGDVINYSYLVTNDGNVTLKGPFTVSDDKTTASCPATTSLAPGESITCTASYTITQSDLDAGSVTNTASASNDTVTSPTDEETVTADKMPALVIDKVAAEEIFAAVGDKIHYTIVATNTGNITLDSVTITDPNVTDLSCTPANGSELAPGASMTCTATHTVTQADIDVGHYINDACVDDGADGATKMCDGADVPADLKPHLAIEKTATETSFDAVGDLIQYSIVATNNGNVTLNNVTVTDPLVKDLSCTPANGASLAPGASMTCTATYTITQADLDAGSFANSACVDDGSGGDRGM